MNYTVGMRLAKTFGDLHPDVLDFGPGHRSAADARFQGLPFIACHHDEDLTVLGFLDAVDGPDVDVIQLGGGARFAQQTRPLRWVGGKAGWKEFEGDDAAEFQILRAKDDPHASSADLFLQQIVADCRPATG